MAPNNSPIQAILLDIEGTTTPVDYVFGVLFPFARNRALDFLQTQGHTEAVRSDLELLRESYNQDLAKGEGIPDWSGNEPIAAVPYIHYLIQVDRKSTGLKSLQGKIWNQGYELGLQ
jgi:enolase-phosphatase E1